MDRHLIERFLQGNFTEQDQQKVYNWLADRNKEHEANALLKRHWETVDKQKTLVDVDLKNIYQQILHEIEEEQVIRMLEDNAVVATESESHRWTPWMTVLKYAAIVVMAFGLGYFVFQATGSYTDKAADSAAVRYEKSTSRGQKSHFILKDGSKIAMNAETKIVYDAGYGVTNRKLTLTGEAFFEVAKNEDLPFQVEANNTVTTALGTAFNISAFDNHQPTTISLTSGKVRVISKDKNGDPGSEVSLVPGQECLMNRYDQRAIVREFDPEKILSWKNNILYFDNTQMSDLIERLERWYNVEVVVVNEERMEEVRGTGQFENESLENVLRVLSYSLQFEYKQKGDTVTITFKD